MLIEDIQRPISPKEAAYRLQQAAFSMNATKALKEFIEGNIYWLESNRQVEGSKDVISKVGVKKTPKHLRDPEVIFNEVERISQEVHGFGLLSTLHTTNEEKDLVVIIPDTCSCYLRNDYVIKSLYKRNIELTTRLIDKLSTRHNRMKVASIVSKVDVFGSSEDRIRMSKDLTQVIVGVNQICPDDADIVIKHYIKPLERAIRNTIEKIDGTVTQGCVQYAYADEVIVIDSKLVDIDELREELKNRI